MSLRIDYYYRIGSVKSVDRVNKIKSELVDVFGPIPRETKDLLSVALLKIRYRPTPVSQISIQDNVIKVIVQPFDEKKQLSFLSQLGAYKNKNLKRISFKDVSGGLLGVFLGVSSSGDVFDLLFDFVHLFGPVNAT